MKKCSNYIIVLIIFALFTESRAQWIKAYNPYNGYVSALSVVGSQIFAGSKGNLYVTENNATNWRSIGLTKPNIKITSIAGEGKVVFVGTEGDGVFLSTDNGSSWNTANIGLANLVVSSLTMRDSLLFLGTIGDGVFHSSDRGKNWAKVNIGISNTSITTIAMSDSIVIAGSSEGKMFLSSDMGISWKWFSLSNGSSITCLISKLGRLFASSSGGGVYVSLNGGQEWVEANNGLYNHMVTSITATDSDLFAGTMMSGVFRSSDFGVSWSTFNSGLSDTVITSLVVCDSNIFLGTQNSGVFLSSVKRQYWSAINTGLISVDINVFLTNGNDVFAGTKGGGVLLSTDKGKSWSARNSGLTELNVRSLAMHDSTIYVAIDRSWIFKSTDYGKNWVPTTFVQASPEQLAMSDSILYVSTGSQGVYQTRNEGKSWQYLGLIYKTLYPIVAKDSLVMTGSYVYEGVFISSNYGKDWTSIGAPYSHSMTTTLGWCGDNIVAGIDYGLYFKAGNGGWIRKDPMKPNPNMIYSMAIKDSLIIIGTYSGLYLSTDRGEKWVTIDSGLTGTVYALAIVGSDLFAGDLDKNVWKRSLTEIVTEVRELKTNITNEFNLNQNYPNPFNPTTIINYSVPKQSNVKLIIYDALGREVANLVNEEKPVGNYTIKFDAKHLASGIYFYQLRVGDFVQTKKMVLLR